MEYNENNNQEVINQEPKQTKKKKRGKNLC